MSVLIIRDEIKNHPTNDLRFHVTEPNTVLPSKKQFVDHVFSNNGNPRSKFQDDLLLKFKTSEGEELKVCLWEIGCSSPYGLIEFYGHCGCCYYGSGLYANKEGYGLRLLSGGIRFAPDGSPLSAYLSVMGKEKFHC